MPPGGHYNEYYPGHVIAMPKPLSDGQVTYAKGANGQPVVPETVRPVLARRDRLPDVDGRTPPPGAQVAGPAGDPVPAGAGRVLYYVKKKIWSDVGGETHGLQPELHKTS